MLQHVVTSCPASTEKKQLPIGPTHLLHRSLNENGLWSLVSGLIFCLLSQSLSSSCDLIPHGSSAGVGFVCSSVFTWRREHPRQDIYKADSSVMCIEGPDLRPIHVVPEQMECEVTTRSQETLLVFWDAASESSRSGIMFLSLLTTRTDPCTHAGFLFLAGKIHWLMERSFSPRACGGGAGGSSEVVRPDGTCGSAVPLWRFGREIPSAGAQSAPQRLTACCCCPGVDHRLLYHTGTAGVLSNSL